MTFREDLDYIVHNITPQRALRSAVEMGIAVTGGALSTMAMYQSGESTSEFFGLAVTSTAMVGLAIVGYEVLKEEAKKARSKLQSGYEYLEAKVSRHAQGVRIGSSLMAWMGGLVGYDGLQRITGNVPSLYNGTLKGAGELCVAGLLLLLTGATYGILSSVDTVTPNPTN